MNLSTLYPYLFYNFLPEIEQTDPEFAEIMKKKETITKFKTEENYHESFIDIIKLDFPKHILNRKLNYHPSLLHKSIREDDIEAFQMQLSKNNINLNDPIEFSYYERSKTMDKNLRPIKVALIYGSIKIFKFLLMNDAILDDNILSYAYFGHNIEIIHLIENRCSFDANTFIQPIVCHRNELLDYLIDKYEFEIVEDNEEVQNTLKDFVDSEDNQYNVLNYKILKKAIISNNFPIVISCLRKIIFIVKNVELIERTADGKQTSNSFIFASIFDFDFLNFLVNKLNPTVKPSNCGILLDCINRIFLCPIKDSINLLFTKFKNILDIESLLFLTIMHNHTNANLILDFLIDKKIICDNLEDLIDDLFYKVVFDYYNEDILVKILILYNPIKTIDDMSDFFQKINKNLTTKMIISLFSRLCIFLRKEILLYVAAAFEDNGKHSIFDFIMKNIPKNNL